MMDPDTRRGGRIRWRKRLWRGVLCLLVGAATTVGVAWCHATWPGKQTFWMFANLPALGIRAGDREWPVNFAENCYGSGHCTREIRHGRTAYIMLGTRWYFSDDRDEPGWLRGSVRSKAPWRELPIADYFERDGWGRLPADDHAALSVAAGWPFRCIWGWHEWQAHPPVESHWLIAGPGGRDLPYRPIVRGFLLDVMLYAALWWLALASSRAIRRWRRRRGGCAACCYDLRGLTGEDGAVRCPECGAIDRARCPAPAGH